MDAESACDEGISKRTAKSYGPGTAKLVSSFRGPKALGGDGGKKARSPGRVRYKPSRHRAGKAGVFPLNLYARVRLFPCAHCTRDRGCSAHPAFPAPSSSRAKRKSRTWGRNPSARSRSHAWRSAPVRVESEQGIGSRGSVNSHPDRLAAEIRPNHDKFPWEHAGKPRKPTKYRAIGLALAGPISGTQGRAALPAPARFRQTASAGMTAEPNYETKVPPIAAHEPARRGGSSRWCCWWPAASSRSPWP